MLSEINFAKYFLNTCTMTYDILCIYFLFIRQEIGSLQSKLSTTRQQYIEISQMKEQYQEEIKHLNTNVTKLQNKLEQTNNTQLLTLKEEKGIQVTMETEREGDVHVHHKEMCSDRDRWEKEREVLLQQQVCLLHELYYIMQL